jgi:hypothetical protein
VLIIIAVLKREVLHVLSVCVCSRSDPVRNAHASYHIAVCGLSGCTIFFPIIL